MSKTIHQPHDKLSRASFQNTALAVDFFAHCLPQSVRELADLNTLSLQNDSFIQANLRAYYSDILFQVDLANQPGYFYLLIETKSQLDQGLATQLIRYMSFIVDRHRKHTGTAEWPLIYPLVFYQGLDGPEQLDPFIQAIDPERAREWLSGPYQIINLNQLLPDEGQKTEETKNSAWLNLMALAYLARHQRDIDRLLERMRDSLFELQQNPLGQSFIRSCFCYLAEISDEFTLEKLEQATDNYIDPDYRSSIMTLAEKLREEGRREGEVEGEARGKAEGEARGKAEVALNMLNAGADLEFVSKMTGLSMQQLRTLQNPT